MTQRSQPILASVLALSASVLTVAPPAAAGQQSPGRVIADESFVADTRTYLQRLGRLGFAGIVVVAQDGKPVLAEGVGLADRERGAPWSPATVAGIGSITKQFTAAALLALEEQGRLKVDDRVSQYLDGVPSDKQAITLHHLLTHTSGILDLEGAGDWDPIGRDEFIRRAMAAPLAFEPGSRYEYSNAGYSLLGAVIERVAGQSYERALKALVLDKVGLVETGYILPGWEPRRLAQGYRGSERWGTTLERPFDTDGPYWVLRANGGIYSTSHDMTRWAFALVDGRVLAPASMQKLWAPHVDETNGRRESFYGYGWVIDDRPDGSRLITHNGGNGIYFADLAIVPSSRLVAFLQTNVIADFPLGSRLLEQISSRLIGGRAYPRVPAVVDVPTASLTVHAGSYLAAEKESYEVEIADGALRVSPLGGAAFARLHGPGEDASVLAERNQQTDRAVKAALGGDFAPFAVLYGDQVPLARLRDGFAERQREAEARLGPLVGHEVLGSGRFVDDRLATVVKFVHRDGSVNRTYVWNRDGRIVGVSMRGLDPRARLFPVGNGRFESWDAFTGVSVPVRFGQEASGGKTLTLGEGPAAMTARARSR